MRRFELHFDDHVRELKAKLDRLPETEPEAELDPSPEPERPEAVRLREAGIALAVAFMGAPWAGRESVVTRMATVLATKVARVSGYLDFGEREVDDEDDLTPNLLLVERLRSDLGGALARDAPKELPGPDDPALRALAELDRLLVPLVATVGEGPRQALAVLVGRRAAPSPFCVTGERGG